MPDLTYPASEDAATPGIAAWLSSASELRVRPILSPAGELEIAGNPGWLTADDVEGCEFDRWVECLAQVREPDFRAAISRHVRQHGTRLPNAWTVLPDLAGEDHNA